MVTNGIERPCLLSKKDALDIIRRFFLKEWKQLSEDDITLTRLQAGLCNAVYIVERSIPPVTTVPAVTEPIKVILKKYGGSITKQTPELSDVAIEAEILIIQEAAKLGIGPKLYGIFEGGRLEEYVHSRHLTTQDLKEAPRIRKEVAVTLARFHSMDLPLPRPQYDFMDVVEARHGEFCKIKDKYPTNEGVVRNKVNAARIVNYDLESDIKWLRKIYTEEHNRMVLQHWDTQFSNILVRLDDYDRSRQSGVVLIDDEMATYNFRGKDLGLLFSQMILDFQHPCDKIGVFPDEEECCRLLKDYQDEVKRLNFLPDFDDKGKDSLEHLYMETLLGAITSAIGFLVYFLRYHEQYIHSNDIIIVNTERIFDWYLHVKEIFCKRFPNIK